MQAAELLDHLLAGAHVEVVGVREHEARSGSFEIVGR